MSKKSAHQIVLVLHNVRSVHNVGAIFRTADAIGVSEIFLTGYTPAPLDRFGKLRKDFAKTALGSERTVPWKRFATLAAGMNQLKKQGFQVAAVEQSGSALHYKKFRPPQKAALVLGNEVQGLSASVLNRCDAVLEIPMRGGKESLNVAVAAGIVLFGIFDRP